ncbi:RloB domain-containing protein [Spiroplasma endosymbiont of Stenodema calcarata]|uniref:RloB domain-containing protein n=1 Tax=Spiroplasma endosymbiont of Stenodema calcarata TaxID=3139328 RepID=UPI003CCB07EF
MRLLQKYIIICFEGKEANTERKYFKGVNSNQKIKDEIFSISHLTFKSLKIKSDGDYKRKLETLLLSIVPNNLGFKVFIILDNDNEAIINIKNNKSKIFEIIVDILNINKKNIFLIELPLSKTFEYYLRLHFLNCSTSKNDELFIKEQLGSNYKQKKVDYFTKLLSLTDDFSYLKENLKINNCEYLKLIKKIIYLIFFINWNFSFCLIIIHF